MSDFPRLEPLTIEKAAYVPNENMVVLRVRFPNGRAAVICSNYQDSDTKDMLSRISANSCGLPATYGAFLTQIPPYFTFRERNAIKQGRVFVGMTKEAVVCALGYPESRNSYGIGEEQWKYDDGLKFVYFNQSGVVKDLQILGR